MTVMKAVYYMLCLLYALRLNIEELEKEGE